MLLDYLSISGLKWNNDYVCACIKWTRCVIHNVSLFLCPLIISPTFATDKRSPVTVFLTSNMETSSADFTSCHQNTCFRYYWTNNGSWGLECFQYPDTFGSLGYLFCWYLSIFCRICYSSMDNVYQRYCDDVYWTVYDVYRKWIWRLQHDDEERYALIYIHIA